MARKKRAPRRSVGIVEKVQSGHVDLNEKNGAEPEKADSVDVAKPLLVDVDRSSWVSHEHFDISEIVFSNLEIRPEFYGLIFTEEFYSDSRYFLRFLLNGVDEFISRIKLGHWPVVSASNIYLHLIERRAMEGVDEDLILVSGNLDGTDEGVTGLVHLASLKFLTLRPITGFTLSEGLSSIRLRVEILRSAFSACQSLLDNTRQLWKKSMMSVMTWLRPEVMTSEARYGYHVVENMGIDLATETVDTLSSESKQVRFDVARFYEAIKPSKQAPMLEDDLPDLLPELRPYQRRAAYWMVQREKGASECPDGTDTRQYLHPLCMPVSLVDTSSRIYYNPFSGNVSLRPENSSLQVPGGILADEMGLGKTVELLACIFAHRMAPSECGKICYNMTKVEGSSRSNLTRLRRERVECTCGAVSESYRYQGLWVQCDICSAWQHADCVGYKPKRGTSKSREVEEEGPRKHTKRRNNVKIVEREGAHICQICSELMQATESPTASGATLIVCPTPILSQWHTEICRHTNLGSLKTCIYEGVRNPSILETPAPDINEFLSADIVLTTYDVLKEDISHDSDRHMGDRRFMRYEKRYPVVPTLLTRILWWRVCLDEAQMVENNAAAATEMALRLHAKYLWCITGTPIQQKLDDLYGLLRFLKASPFDVFRWWTDVIRDPYEKGDVGATQFTHNLFRTLMWRSSKVHVAEELQLPPQEECISWLSLSAVEEHFYQRQHETCADDAREVIKSFKDDILKRKTSGSRLSDLSSDHIITNVEAAKLFNSLLKLRQACCHPQVGSSGLRSLQQSPMTMEEILLVLIGKTKVEGEEALRKLVSALNGLAGIAIIKQDFPQAVALYKEALDLVEEHSEDFRLDPLLNIHIHHNLAEILSRAPDSLKLIQAVPGNSEEKASVTIDLKESDQVSVKRERMMGDDSDLPLSRSDFIKNGSTDKACDSNPHIAFCVTSEKYLRTACETLKHKFISAFSSKLSVAQHEFRNLYMQVSNAFSDRKNQHSGWWLEALHHIEQNKDSSNELIRKITEVVSGSLNTSRTSRIASCFRSIGALKYYIQTSLDSLEESRKTVLERLVEIDQTMENPREEDILGVRYCPKCQADGDGTICVLCELDGLFQVYEARLFRLNKDKNGSVITSAEEAVDLQKKQSELNRFYWTLYSSDKNATSSTSGYEDNGKKRDVGERVMVTKSPSDLEFVLGIIKKNSKGLLDRDGLSAAKKQLLLHEVMRKEYAQARALAIAQAQVLHAHDEIKMATSRLRLKEDQNDRSIDALDLDELDAANAQNSSDKFLAASSLSHVKGQLRYLKGLVQSKQNLQSESSNTSTLTNTMLVSSTPRNERSVSKPDEEACPICHEMLSKEKMVFQCGHFTCCKCFFAMSEKRLEHHGRSQEKWIMCPTCRKATDYRNIAYAVDHLNDLSDSSSQPGENPEATIAVHGSYSTKIEAVTRRILWINSTDPAAKILVFSSWNDVLDVLEHAFQANNIGFIRMKGGKKSHVSISQFKEQKRNRKNCSKKHDGQQESKTIQVLLLLIQHGANGLNLLEAQHVILVEPLLNPAAEAQAIGRVHRIGQTEKTLVHRFIVKDTVEESIYRLNKCRNTSSFLSGNRKNQDHPVLTLGDVESLFRVAPPTDQNPTGSLMHLPPSVAATLAAERRRMESSTWCL